jgi:hypothetical protein
MCHPPSASFTVTSFQKRFFSMALGLLEAAEVVRVSFTRSIIAAALFLRASLSDAAEGWAVGVPGGGPGTEGCGRGVARHVADVWRHW